MNPTAPPTPADPAAGDNGEAFRLADVAPTAAPPGSAGRDWHKYRIAQGSNVITGFRRGDLATVTADVEKIVDSLNERRIVNRKRADARSSR